MTHLEPKNPYSPEVHKIFEGIENHLGFVPNIYRLMGHSKPFLEGFLTFSKSFDQGKLSPMLRESIALTVAGFNKCAYCTRAHTVIGEKKGLSHEEAQHNLAGKSNIHKTVAALEFVTALLKSQGKVSKKEIETLAHHFSEEEILEIVGVTMVNMTTNYFNNAFQPNIDF